MRPEIHHAIDDVSREWDDLAERCGASPFMRPGWFAPWRAAFGSGSLELHTIRDDGRLVALVPLERRGRFLRSPTNWHSPEFALIAEDATTRRRLLESVLADGAPLSLAFLNAGAPDVLACLEASDVEGRRLLTRRLEQSPFVRIEGSWEQYERTLDRHRRSETRRRRRRLEEQGRLELRIEDGGNRLNELLSAGFAIEGSGWKAEQGTAIASQPETREFYARVAEWAARRGWLRLAFLELDERPLAFQYLIQHAGVAYQLKGGYDPAYRKYSPGMLLAYDVLAWGFQTGLRSYEFLGEQDRFKLEFAREARDRIQLQAFPRTASGTVGWAAFAYGRPLARRVRALGAR